MFEKLTDEEERGQVGIGTLIVFIAMVLVAAIAAGVLINTAGVLQTQASNTGSETQEQVANQVEVLHASGHVGTDTGESGTVESVDMTLMKSAGSNEIDLESMTVQYTSDHTDTTLTYGDVADSDTFSTSPLHGGTEGDSLTTKDDRVKMTLDTQAIEANGANGEATITVSGSSETEDLTVVDGSSDISTNPEVGGDLEVSLATDNSENAEYTAPVDVTVKIDNEVIASEENLNAQDDDSFTINSEDFSQDDQLSIDIVDSANDEEVSDDTSLPTIDIEDLNDDAAGLQPGTSATVSLVDQSGAQFTYGISVPSTFGTASIVEV